MGILCASSQLVTIEISNYVIMGELSLDGILRPVRGALPMALHAKSCGFKGVILPVENAKEAAVVEGIDVYGIATLLEVIKFLKVIQQFFQLKLTWKQNFLDH